MPPHSKVFFAAVALWLLGLAPVFAATLTVTNTNNSGAGSLRDTIVAAAPNDTIVFATNLSGTITLTSGELLLNKNVTIAYTGAGLTISGNNASRVLFVANGVSATVSGLRIANGNGLSTLAANGLGGGIYNLGTLTLRDCTVASNFSSAGFGGGVASNGTLTLDRCTFASNVTPGAGGAVANLGTLRAQNSTFSGNNANGDGGGIFNPNNANARLVNCTLTANRADAENNGSGTGGALAAIGPVTLENTIVTGNLRGNGAVRDEINGTVTTANFNLIGDAASAGGIVHGASGNIVGKNGSGTLATGTVVSPTLANNGGPTATHAPVFYSPALNAGSNVLAVDANNAPLATDQRGGARIINATVDIGAVESSSPVVLNLNDSGAGSLRQAIADAPSGDTITFAAGLEGAIVLQSELAIRFRDVVIQSQSGRITVSGNQTWKPFVVDRCNATLIGLRVVNGGSAVAQVYQEFDPNGLGGGLYSYLANVTLRNCSFSGNTADAGGAIYQEGPGQLNVFNCTISGNSLYPNGSGGGIVSTGDLFIANSTIVGNVLRGLEIFGSCTLRNSIVAGNSGGDISGGVSSAANNLIGDAASAGGIVHGTNGNIVGNNGSGTINLATVLNPALADNGGTTLSHMLAPGSPALNAGLNSAAPDVTDQRGPGFVRIFNGTVDMGAIEARPGVAARWSFGQQPPNGMANFPLSPAVTVRLLDDLGQPVTNQPVALALSVSDPTNLQSGRLDPAGVTGASATTVNGIASFPNLATTRARADLRLVTTGALGRATSAPFTTVISPVLNTNHEGPGSLRAMIEDSLPGDVITFQPGVSGTIRLISRGAFRRQSLEVRHALTVIGPGAGVVTIDGNGQTACFFVNRFSFPPSFACTISGFTLVNGSDNGEVARGGGIAAFGVALTVNDCVVSNHLSSAGISANEGEFGGAPASLTLNRCVISGNDSIGIDVSRAELYATDCTIADNGADGILRNQRHCHRGEQHDRKEQRWRH